MALAGSPSNGPSTPPLARTAPCPEWTASILVGPCRSGPYQVANGRHKSDMTLHEEVGPPSAPGCAGKCGCSSLLRTCVWHRWKLSHCLQPLSELHPLIMGSGNRSHDPPAVCSGLWGWVTNKACKTQCLLASAFYPSACGLVLSPSSLEASWHPVLKNLLLGYFTSLIFWVMVVQALISLSRQLFSLPCLEGLLSN